MTCAHELHSFCDGGHGGVAAFQLVPLHGKRSVEKDDDVARLICNCCRGGWISNESRGLEESRFVVTACRRYLVRSGLIAIGVAIGKDIQLIGAGGVEIPGGSRS